LNFPDKVTVTAIDAETGSEIAGVAFVLWLKARRKNDYFVGPAITELHGQAEFTRDYTGDLASCGPTAELQLHPPERIAGMIRQYEAMPQFWGIAFDNPQELFRDLRRARNSLFEPFQLVVEERNILQRPAVTCFLRRKPGAAL